MWMIALLALAELTYVYILGGGGGGSRIGLSSSTVELDLRCLIVFEFCIIQFHQARRRLCYIGHVYTRMVLFISAGLHTRFDGICVKMTHLRDRSVGILT